ncbi:hypothetical protein NE237_009047 [Protea cynaroides]|uniref:Uncharacterized protein n=1 Tax=Protea cynaroides TaxID=273540 RepID=A0A9Q0R091_9MAGN|nr:hypothetical protein NE237_009047 [Protea cynaroides]
MTTESPHFFSTPRQWGEPQHLFQDWRIQPVRSFPSTMAAIRLSGMEISDLTLELSDLRYPHSGRSNELDQSSHLLTMATRDLFTELDRNVKPVAPMHFLTVSYHFWSIVFMLIPCIFSLHECQSSSAPTNQGIILVIWVEVCAICLGPYLILSRHSSMLELGRRLGVFIVFSHHYCRSLSKL